MRDLKIFTNNVDEKALMQIDSLLSQEAFQACKVRIMPDVHAGAGCVIGFTANLGDKVIPDIVGVDIGCGMSWVKIDDKIDLAELDKVIAKYVPSGISVRKTALDTDINIQDLYCYGELENVRNRIERSLGTLGGGNHFIEVDADEQGNNYLVVHSGSRNLGKQVCDIYQHKAIAYCSVENRKKAEIEETIENLKQSGKHHLIEKKLMEIQKKYSKIEEMPKSLCYIEGQMRENYLHDMRLCQKWASQNRANIIDQICSNLGITPSEYHETIHNYISDDNIVRKGAISAQKDEIVLIPMNMRDGCIIARGKGNEDWNCSAPHGAGRIMSRMKAKELLNLKEYEKEMEGIYSSSVSVHTIDEAPMAYKPMEEILNHIGDTVEVIKIIKPIYNFKAKD